MAHHTKSWTKKALAVALCATLCCSLVGLNGCASIERKGSSGSFGQLKELFSSKVVRNIKIDEPVATEATKAEPTTTVLVYMNGSNLESEDGEATIDLNEMVAAGTSDKVNVLVQTMGTKKWDKTFGISGKRTQRYKVSGKGLALVDDSLGQLDTTKASTLQDFISWGAANYPADRYILLFWNHGGGPVYGFGYDEYQPETEALTIDEMKSAMKNAGVFFDIIGMDCCLMSSLEVCMALYENCNYTILSEDFESGLGWYYTTWMQQLYQNPAIPAPELGKTIVDSMVNANANNQEWGTDSILTMVDESVMKVLYTAWTDFAYANEDTLLEANYSQPVEASSNSRAHPAFVRGHGWNWAEDFSNWAFEEYTNFGAELSDYYITDIMAVAQNVNSKESKALSSALDQAIVYTNSTAGDSYMSGLSVTLPYGDWNFYQELKEIFTNCGFDSNYINWLQNFTVAEGYSSFYNYEEWNGEWEGWDTFDDDFDWESWDYYDNDEYWDWLDEESGWTDFDYHNTWNEYYHELLEMYGTDHQGGWGDGPQGGGTYSGHQQDPRWYEEYLYSLFYER